jgi:hypothetical protein
MLASETIAKADGVAEFVSAFRFGSRLKIQQDENTFAVAAWTLPIDGDVVTDAMGARWRARRQGSSIIVTAARGDASAGTNSSLTMLFRLTSDDRLSVEITADPVLEWSTVTNVYSRSAKAVAPPALPGFAGRWIVDEAASELNGSTAWFTNEAVISLETRGLTVSGSGMVSGKSFYPTDGSDPVRSSGPRGTALSQAEWRGSQLVATHLSYTIATDRATKQ